MSAGLARTFELQSEWCRKLGSPMYADILDALAGDVRDDGIAIRVVAPYAGDPPESALALRLLAAVHRIALRGDAPELAACYPSCGGTPNARDAVPAFFAV